MSSEYIDVMDIEGYRRQLRNRRSAPMRLIDVMGTADYKRSIKERRQARKNQNVVLDIDETCVHTSDSPEPSETSDKVRPRYYRFTLGSSVFWGVTRPHLDMFIRFCFDRFNNVIVWSAGQYDYVHQMVKTIFVDRPPNLILTREDCTSKGGLLTKPLSKVYSRVDGANETNTLIVDDRETVYSLDNPDNGINIPAYSPSPMELEMDDRAFLQLMRYMMLPEVVQSTDVRTLDKSKIFT